MILPKTITLVPHPEEATSYAQADEFVRSRAAYLKKGERATAKVVVLFADLFIWGSHLSIGSEDATGQHFIQRAIQADWEFNAGVRPPWWPHTPEADRMWGVHYREDRDNGRAELARMRLERYDLQPLVLSPLPVRNSPSL